MEIEAHLWYWTEHGMRRGGVGNGYIEKREVESLLEEAHRRGKEAGRLEGLEEAKDVIRRTPIRPG